jgi:hypothetical protein
MPLKDTIPAKSSRISDLAAGWLAVGWFRHSALVLTGVSPFMLLLWSFATNTILLDWGYFNGLSLVVRSSVLHYGVFPLHNPWVGGGLDLLANPQSRVFSPLILLDILFPPHYANLLSLVILSVAGVYGFYRLLLFLGFSPSISLLGSFLFVHGTYFSLHFSVGHIPFGAFQLSGLALYFILRIREFRFKVYYALINAFFLLNGAVYAFIFTQFLFLSTLFITYSIHDWKKLLNSITRRWKGILMTLAAFICLTAPKTLPFLWVFGSGQPNEDDFLSLPVNVLISVFFNPFQWYGLDIPGFYIKGSFYEGGAYLGILGGFVIMAAALYFRHRVFWRFFLLMVFFFWLGSGWLGWANLWHLKQFVPLANNVHIQSRLFVFVFLFFVILLCFALKYLKSRWPAVLYYLLIGFFIAESVYVSVYPYNRVLQDKSIQYPSEILHKLIDSHTIDTTLANSQPLKDSMYSGLGFDFLHYYKKNKGTVHTYEPYTMPGTLTSVVDKDYRGEVFVEKKKGAAEILRFIPGEVHIRYALNSPSHIVVNTNFLGGWISDYENNKVFSARGLLAFAPEDLKGEVVLRYRPAYLYFILPLFVAGIFLFAFLLTGKQFINNYGLEQNV